MYGGSLDVVPATSWVSAIICDLSGGAPLSMGSSLLRPNSSVNLRAPSSARRFFRRIQMKGVAGIALDQKLQYRTQPRSSTDFTLTGCKPVSLAANPGNHLHLYSTPTDRTAADPGRWTAQMNG